MIGQLDKLNKLQKTFVYGSKSHVPDYYIDASNRKFKIVTDYLGSVRLIVSSTGVVSEVMEHDEFGRILQDTKPGLTPFGFAGGLYDYKTSLVRFGARDYDAEAGRWLSKDPIRFNGRDANLYGDVLQDPVNLIDPTGLIKKEQVLGGSFVISGGWVTSIGVVKGGIIGGAVVSAGGGLMLTGAFMMLPTADAGNNSDIIPGNPQNKKVTHYRCDK